jgi:hypothetical protein
LSIPENAVRVIAAPPETITQRNVEAVTGLSVRAYLEVVRDPGFPLTVTKLGKLRIVNRAAFITWLEKGAFGRARANEDAIAIDAEQADDILDALGLHQERAKTNNKKSIRG